MSFSIVKKVMTYRLCNSFNVLLLIQAIHGKKKSYKMELGVKVCILLNSNDKEVGNISFKLMMIHMITGNIDKVLSLCLNM